MNFYVEEKLKELERERAFRNKDVVYTDARSPRRRPVVGGVVATAGRILQRMGSGLEGWGSPPDGDEPRLVRRLLR
jgi:hypothetical protein